MARKIAVSVEIHYPDSDETITLPDQMHDLPYGWDGWEPKRREAYLNDIADAEIANHTIATATVEEIDEG